MLRSMARAYWELTKPRIMTMVLVTTFIGFLLAGHGISSWSLLFFTLLGTYCVGAGSSVLNHYMERDADALMERTRNRPLPRGIVSSVSALFFGMNLVLFGLLVLYWQVNLLTAFFALLGAFLYNFVYTPMKRLSWLNTFVGSIPGALPPLWGWTAVTGEASVGGWSLFLILVLWQFPHFFAIAWMYKEDYARGGFKMLPVISPDGRSTFFQIVFFSIVLIPVSLIPMWVGMTGAVYGYGMLFLGALFVLSAFNLWQKRSYAAARMVLRMSVIYLPLWLLLVVGDGLL